MKLFIYLLETIFLHKTEEYQTESQYSGHFRYRFCVILDVLLKKKKCNICMYNNGAEMILRF